MHPLRQAAAFGQLPRHHPDRRQVLLPGAGHELQGQRRLGRPDHQRQRDARADHQLGRCRRGRGAGALSVSWSGMDGVN